MSFSKNMLILLCVGNEIVKTLKASDVCSSKYDYRLLIALLFRKHQLTINTSIKSIPDNNINTMSSSVRVRNLCKKIESSFMQ